MNPPSLGFRHAVAHPGHRGVLALLFVVPQELRRQQPDEPRLGQERRVRRDECLPVLARLWRVGIENPLTSRDLHVLVEEAAEPVSSEHATDGALKLFVLPAYSPQLSPTSGCGRTVCATRRWHVPNGGESSPVTASS
jgi:hypothetical protein